MPAILEGMKTITYLALSTLGACLWQQSSASLVYQSDFQNGVSTNWNANQFRTDLNGVKLFGLFENQQVTLNLGSRSAGLYKIDMTFVIVNSWDGLTQDGPDILRIGTQHQTLVDAVFSNYTTNAQTYSALTPINGASVPGRTDNAGIDLLSFATNEPGTPVRTTNYSPSFTVNHPGGLFTLNFQGAVSQPGQVYLGMEDEAYGLLNTRVEAVPEPASLLSIGAGLIWMSLKGRRKA
jgi:hypothetical protein